MLVSFPFYIIIFVSVKFDTFVTTLKLCAQNNYEEYNSSIITYYSSIFS